MNHDLDNPSHVRHGLRGFHNRMDHVRSNGTPAWKGAMMMTQEQFEALPAKQKAALADLQRRSGYDWSTFLAKCLAPCPITDYVGVTDFHGMFVGVESDGYTHS